MLPIIYKDEYLVAVDKPSGLLVHRSLLDKRATEFAMQMVRNQIGQHVFPVHRLDRPTSGVLLFALSPEVATLSGDLISQHKVKKVYRALVRGFVKTSGRLDYPLKEELDKIADKMARQDKEAQEAVTDFRPLAHFELPFAVGRYQTARYTLMELLPKTGRKHQLRRHMAHLRHPIGGDTTHGDGKHNRFLRDTFGLDSLCLSCVEMSMPHPVTGEDLVIKTEIGASFAHILSQWGDYRVSHSDV